MQLKKEDIWGIDYGSKLAGTTVIGMVENGAIIFRQSGKKQDADRFILDAIENSPPKLIMLDAPLSLPTGLLVEAPGPGAEFFYRVCDKLLGAMSPMFLGGLTARAIRLSAILRARGIMVLETYPKILRNMILANNQPELWHTDQVKVHLPSGLSITNPENPHQWDALMAWLSGYRFSIDLADVYGNEEEGMIWV